MLDERSSVTSSDGEDGPGGEARVYSHIIEDGCSQVRINITHRIYCNSRMRNWF